MITIGRAAGMDCRADIIPPISGMFAFGIFHKVKVKELYVPIVCVAAPLLSYALKLNSEELLNGYKIGFELLIFNGLLTYLGFWLIAKKSDEKD